MKLRRVAAGAISVVLAITMVSTSAFAVDPSFKDVPSNHWAKQSITAMADKGIMTGVADGVFAPSNTLTYAEFFTMVSANAFLRMLLMTTMTRSCVGVSTKFFWQTAGTCHILLMSTSSRVLCIPYSVKISGLLTPQLLTHLIPSRRRIEPSSWLHALWDCRTEK